MPEPNERRAAERFPVSATTTCPFLSPVLEDLGPIRVKDISLAGVSVLVPQPLEVGMLLAVTLANPVQAFRKTVLVRVAHCTPSKGLFLVGGNFDAPLRYEELKALVL